MKGRTLPWGMAPMLLWMASPASANNLGSGQSDFGGIGLMQTPTARMAPAGDFAINASRTSPYRRYSIFMQPTEWLEGGFRYTSIENRLYGPSIAGDRDYLDKSIDAKIRLHKESRYLPELALGVRDLGGTTFFGSEFIVASKRWHSLDFSLGLGWGYLGNRGDMDSPLSLVSNRFRNRPEGEGGDQAGDFQIDQLFSGNTAFFGGIEYQTPWDPLVLQLEYEGNDYANEPLDNDQPQDSRFNLGARYRLTDNFELHAGWQRGNTAMAGITFSTNLAGLSQVKRDPPPAPINAPPEKDWPAVAAKLQDNAGIRVDEIRQDGEDLIVSGEPVTFRNLAKSQGRAGRILHANADEAVETFHYRWQNRGLGLREDVHDRSALVAATSSQEAETAHRYGIYSRALLNEPTGETLYQDDPQRFSWSTGPAIEQNFGGPDGYLYRLSAFASAEYTTDPNGWFSGSLTATLADNLDEYEYIAESDLPRVRTHIGDYLAEADVGISNLQYTRTAQLGDDLYAMGYGGLLETMYAGAGGELLYRPFNSDLALGLDMNWVQQREFDQQFGLRDYETWTGHATAYWETGFEDMLAQLSVGRYLAGDYGATLDVSREFDNGVRVGAWTTFTDAGDAYGEGSFDKAFYVSIPLDAFFVRSSRGRSTIAWQPLTRDGGARLSRQYQLYGITNDRDMGRYWENYQDSWD